MVWRLTKKKEKHLLDKAWEASANAYAPYSSFHVGAAVLTDDGEIITGCNVECAAYPSGICAERTAVSGAVARGYRKFKAIAIVAKSPTPTPPCGGCRQFIAEFGPRLVVIYSNGKETKRTKMNTLLPELFEESFFVPDEDE